MNPDGLGNDCTQNIANLICLIRLYHVTENYREMLTCCKQLSLIQFEITNEHLELFTRCFKNLIGVKRGQFRKIEALIERDNIKENKKNLHLLDSLKKNLCEDLYSLCHEVVNICNNLLDFILVNNKNKKAKLYFLKTLADHFRYLYELDYLDKYLQLAIKCYADALLCAENDKFAPTDMTYLTFFLNYSVFLHDVLNNQEEAIKRAKTVLHSALKNTEEITDSNQKDIILICQMIKDNLSLWKNQIPEEFERNNQM